MCRIALADGGAPYVVPVNFGYQDGCLYFHSDREGKKMDILRRNSRVCFEVDIDQELVRRKTACQWGMRYRSVIGFGRAFFVEGREEKRAALDIIMQHYSDGPFQYDEKQVDEVAIVRVEIDSMTGKQAGY